MSTDEALVRSLPKVALHDHLDGGLRPATIVELADRIGYRELPGRDPDELARWFARAAHGGGLEQYLEGFRHTVAVMQTAEALNRVAQECVHDFADDGVVYAEVRYAPELHTDGGLSIDSVVEAVVEGFATASAERGITAYVLLSAMRQGDRSMQTAEAAVRWRDRGVVGFDIAGPEKGFPPTQHLPAFQLVQRANFHSTIHAGEAFGLPSIWEALQWCGAERLGHGVRVVDDIMVNPDGTATLGRLAAYVRDRRVPLEMCPTSNVNTGVAASIAEHPIGLLHDLRFRVTVNTDNRLMSGTTMTGEMMALSAAFGYELNDIEWFTVNSMKSAFAPFDERLALINGRIKPAYAEARARIALPG